MDRARMGSHGLVCACLLALLTAAGAAARSSGAPNRGQRTYSAEAEADRVASLPGAPDLDFGLFSGYINVDEAAGRALFYVFAESRTRPAEAPLLLWLNGGPGCSSIGGGFMSELGPFYPNKDGTSLQPNPYSWNDLANVLWLESPAFVGFSYSNSSEDAVVGDARTAADARLFLLHWLRRFPQYAHADLYLSGESYGGHYVPNLALEIVWGNARAAAAPPLQQQEAAGSGKQQQQEPAQDQKDGVVVAPGKGFLNLKGFFVGNAWTDAAIDNRGALDFWYSHAMVGAESYAAISHNCDFNTIGPLMRGAQALALPYTHTQAGAAAAAAAGAANGGVLQPPGAAGGREDEDEGMRQRRAARLVAEAANKASSPSSPPPSAPAAAHATAAAATPPGLSGGGSVGGELGHSRLSGWSGYGSSLTTRFWEALGLGGFRHDDSKDVICARWLDIAQAELGNINIYEIYADVCLAGQPDTWAAGSSGTAGKRYRGALLGDLAPRKKATGAGAGAGAAMLGDDVSVARQPRRPRYDPCIDGEVEAYLNLPEVQAALHANQTVKLPWRWTDCTDLISYSREDLLASMLPVYHQLLTAEPALKIWVFSGDVDGIVPVLGSRRWVESLQLPVVKPWRAWTSSTGQVGGWRVDYEGLTFATVRNSGHMVPYVTPERAFSLLGQFLYGEKPAPAGAGGGGSGSSSSGTNRDAAGGSSASKPAAA